MRDCLKGVGGEEEQGVNFKTLRLTVTSGKASLLFFMTETGSGIIALSHV